jgi:hypothetical protein
MQGFEYSCKSIGVGRSEGHEQSHFCSLKYAEASRWRSGLSDDFST